MEGISTDNYYASFINMDHRKDRLTHMLNQLNRIGLNATRTRGMRPEEYKGDHSKVAAMYKRTQGAIGCHFSQVQVMKDALERDKHAFVMEDDLIFCEDFKERWDYILEYFSFNKEWDVFWLGSSFHVNPPYWHCKGGSKDRRNNASAELGYDAKLTDYHRIIRTYGAFATFAYLVNKNSIKKILDLFDQHIHKSIGIDWLMILLQPQLKCYAFLPGCVRQMDSMSDIGTGVTNWSGFLQLNGTKENSSYVYQERMEMFEPAEFKWNECN